VQRAARKISIIKGVPVGKSVKIKPSLFQAWDAVSYAAKNEIRWVAKVSDDTGDEVVVCYDVYLDLPVNQWSEYPA
jgi:hypothetical protein